MSKVRKKKLNVNGETFVLYLSEKQIQQRLKQLATKISKDYNGRIPIFIGVLNGAFVFMSDLIRHMTISCEVDFLKLSSYGDAKISSGKVTMLKELNCQVEGRDIIVVEDIIDSGLSIDFMRRLVSKMNPRSINVVALLYKKKAIKIHTPVKYIGFKIPNKFVIGYGLDYQQQQRNLRGVYCLENEKEV
ncbi:MAG: hypoxanthine phosphoribosyltransferase [Bacteroidetes bacterium]|nr:MAG: hypoxanthine phosphoribosyltransferase [Bacteroidota bacterium]